MDLKVCEALRSFDEFAFAHETFELRTATLNFVRKDISREEMERIAPHEWRRIFRTAERMRALVGNKLTVHLLDTGRGVRRAVGSVIDCLEDLLGKYGIESIDIPRDQ